jgi:hypothetical protein
LNLISSDKWVIETARQAAKFNFSIFISFILYTKLLCIEKNMAELRSEAGVKR